MAGTAACSPYLPWWDWLFVSLLYNDGSRIEIERKYFKAKPTTLSSSKCQDVRKGAPGRRPKISEVFNLSTDPKINIMRWRAHNISVR